jgi:1,4-dihydroxy-2-naphthoate octaprenyltransferase
MEQVLAEKPNKSLKEALKGWIQAFRLPFHSVGVAPFTLGALLAWRWEGLFNWPVYLLGVGAVILIMGMTYFTNEYFDFETDVLNKEFNKFSGGSRALPDGQVSRPKVLVAALILLGLAALVGLSIQFVFKTGSLTLPLGIFGILAGFFYTAKPVQLAYRGFGEVLIAICYGWLPVFTGYYLLAGFPRGFLLHLFTVPIALTIFLVILINEFPDFTSDQASEKKNLVVRLGRERASLVYILASLLALVALFLPFWAGLSVRSWWLLLLPASLGAFNLLSVVRSEWQAPSQLESICARTIGFNLLVTLTYSLAIFL